MDGPQVTLSTQEALVYTMVLASAVDTDMKDAELRTMMLIVQALPVFQGMNEATSTRREVLHAAHLDR